VEISSAAKQLQESEHLQEARSRYILEIKQAVESGEYKVDPYKTAEKMIEYWTKK
jgi:negative regulator of flagellin synthesis FlgM